MIQVPTLERDGSVPFGLLYAASAAYRNGHNVKILDLVRENLSYGDVKKIIEDFSPRLVGLGGITASYKNCKELVANIKNDFKNIVIVVGGVLASIPDLLLKNAHVDFVVHGEGEISFPNLIKTIEEGGDVSAVKGISFLKGEKICRTDIQPQISNLDDIPIPECTLLDVDKYLEPAENWVDWYFKHDKDEHRKMLDRLSGKKLFPIITSRGCPYRCIFCYRHHRGLRQHSVKYIINMIKFLRDNYDVGIFQISDELTTANKKWVLSFCDAVINEDLNSYFIVLSARADTVDEEMLVKLKEAGCMMINYGYESGSDVILKEIKKSVTRQQNLRAGILTKNVVIKNIPEIMIGFPSETQETVKETIDFLKQIDTWPISINTPIPFPQTPLWQYAVEHSLINDKEGFVLGYRRWVFVNFTKYSDKKVLRLANKVKYDVQLHWLKNRKSYGLYLVCFLQGIFVALTKSVLPNTTYVVLRKVYRKFIKG